VAKLDQAKESLNNHRLALTILIGLEVVLVGGVATSYRAHDVDLFFWLGVDLAVLMPLAILFEINHLIRETREIGAL
jgi:hypothetical protein